MTERYRAKKALSHPAVAPFQRLDAESSRRVMEPLRRLMEGRTTIVISHNLLTAREATEILVLQDGRVAERGAHQELLERNGAYAHLYRLHQTEERAAPTSYE